MSTCLVSGTFLDPSEAAISGAAVTFTVENPVLNASSNLLLPKQISTTTAADGTWSLAISQGCGGVLTLQCPPNSINSAVPYSFSLAIPNTSTATFASVWADANNPSVPSGSVLTFAMIAGQLATNQLPALNASDVWVGNSSNVATAVAMSGDGSLSNAGSLTIGTVGTSSAANIHSAELLANAATNLNTTSAIVKRDSSGNFSAGTITASLSGNATSATSFSGSLVGDVVGTQGATVVQTVGTSSATNIHNAELLANAATDANTVSTIVKRDSSGNFSAGTITAALSGSATNVSGTVAINHGGSGQTTQQAAIDALTGSQSSGKYLRSDGSHATLSTLDMGDAGAGTLSVARGGTGAGSFTAHGVVTGGSGTVLQTTLVGSTNTVLKGNTGSDPTFGQVALSTDVTGILPEVNGGTNQSSYTLGDTLYSSASNTLAKLSGNTTSTKKFLRQTGTGSASAAPAWDTVVAGDITSGQIAIANGGTGQATKSTAFDALSPMSASGDIIYGGASGTGTRLAKGSDTQVLTLASGLPTWATPSSGAASLDYYQGFTAAGNTWDRSSSTMGDPTPGATNALTSRQSSGITVSAAASNLPGVTFTPAASTSVYLITVQTQSISNAASGGNSITLTDGTNVITSHRWQFNAVSPQLPGYPISMTGVFVPGTASAVTIKLQVSNSAATLIEIGNNAAGTGVGSIEWSIVRIK